MSIVQLLVLAGALAAPEVELLTLSGEQHRGELTQISATTVTIVHDGKTLEVPAKEVLEVAFTRPAAPEARPEADPLPFVALVDRSLFQCSKIATAARQATLESPALGKLSVPLPAVANIRFGKLDARSVQETWDELCRRDLKRDLLVIRKEGDVLDHLDGTVGAIDDELVRFVLDGDEVPVKREKVFGVVYARPAAAGARPVCEVRLAEGDVLQVKQVSWDGDQFQAALAAGPQVKLPLDRLQGLDFSQGKVRYLSQLEPRETQYTPALDDDFTFRRDRTYDNKPLLLGDKTYSRGLWIHPKTYLKYRIDGDYRHFRAVMGIDENLGLSERRANADVHVVISGDGKPLFEAVVLGTDEPRVLDLDVSGVRDLEILVDFARDTDFGVCDHLSLGDARVIK